MDKITKANDERREERSYVWLLEILLVVTITPALVFGVNALKYLPVT